MNCQDISRFLDEGDIRMLDDVGRRDVALHHASCRDCAGDWAVERHLSALPVPPMPADLAARCRLLVAANAAAYSGTTKGGDSRRSSRLILLGTAVVVAAAAAILGYGLVDLLRERTSGLTASVPVAAALPREDQQAETPAAPAAGKAPTRTAASKPQSFTVFVRPLRLEVSDVDARAKMEAHYDRLLEELRGIHGAVLLHATPGDGEEEPKADVLIAVTGERGVRLGTQNYPWSISIAAEQFRTGKSGERLFGGNAMSTEGLGPLTDPARTAAKQLDFILGGVFPYDAAIVARLRRRLADLGLDFAARSTALQSLQFLAGRSGKQLWNADLVRSALDLATSAPTPEDRANIWRSLKGARDPAFIQPLIDLSRQEANEGARVEVVAMLASDFSDSAEARAALESVARDDSSELVRMVAQRASSGEEAWNRYVRSTVENTELSDQQRLEPLLYMIRSSQFREFSTALDDGAASSLIEVLPRIWADQKNMNGMLAQLITILVGGVNTPAVRQFSLDVLNGNAPLSVRSGIPTALGLRYPNDPEIHAALTRVAAEDPDPRMRQSASLALQGPAMLVSPLGTPLVTPSSGGGAPAKEPEAVSRQ